MNFFAGQKPSADLLYALNYATTYVPTLTASVTDPNLGADGTAVGAYHRSGLLITGWVKFVFSGAGIDAGSNNYRFDLPFDADTSILNAGASPATASIIGPFGLSDASALGNSLTGIGMLFTASLVRMFVDGDIAVDNATIAWGEGDAISATFAYLADPAGLPFGT